MCGITLVWNKEGVFPLETFSILLEEAEKRGQDGFGFAIINNGLPEGEAYYPRGYSVVKDEVLKLVEANMKVGSLFLANCRAQPETEVSSENRASIQPIVKDDIVLVHNGSVANFIADEFSDLGYKTKIDSEAIINAYLKFGRDMKKVMEHLVGGFAFILVDGKTKRMFCVNDYKPLAIGYIRGRGFIVHSEESAIAKVVEKITDCTRCGTNVWEDFYYHPQEDYTIREIDLDSGMERLYQFSPRFYHPVWNCLEKDEREIVFVCASGGIDSGLSAFVMDKLGYEVELIHFDYGQKSEDAERLAVYKLAEIAKCNVKIIDLQSLFLEDPSELLKKDLKIKTGTADFIKSTTSWVASRNLVFLAYLTSLAEQRILSRKCGRVIVVSGMSSLSEEGFFPDNSQRFLESFFRTAKLGTIVGDRIRHVPLFRDILKAEEWVLGNALKFPFEWSCSCDFARVREGRIELCEECGSTLLSRWAAERAGIVDTRKFYCRDAEVEVMKKKFEGSSYLSLEKIISRILFWEEKDKEALSLLCRMKRS